MLKKRVIFTLLYDKGYYNLSRNFRLQKIGDIKWLKQNYNFSQVSNAIDELILLNVSRGDKHQEYFFENLKRLNEECFIPISAGGGIRDIRQARSLLRFGADKVVINSALFDSQDLVFSIASEFGRQCIVASLDVKRKNGKYRIFIENGTKEINESFDTCIGDVLNLPIGEMYLNSIDRDGTGQGYDLNLIKALPDELSIPVIIAGGVGKQHHLAEGLRDQKIDAVATAHLFNFLGDSLQKTREALLEENFSLPVWNFQQFKSLKRSFHSSTNR